jgi:hypothetical protein
MNNTNLESAIERGINSDSLPLTTRREPSALAPDLVSYTHPMSTTQTGGDKIVYFNGPNDPARPINWPMRKKIITTVMYGMTTAGATWLSSVYTAAEASISKEFNVAPEVSTLGVTLFLFGFVASIAFALSITKFNPVLVLVLCFGLLCQKPMDGNWLSCRLSLSRLVLFLVPQLLRIFKRFL